MIVPKQPQNDTDRDGVPIFRNDHANDIVELLRMRACPPEGEYLESDHGHSDCYLEREAADEIERLRNEILRLRQKRMAQSHEIAVLRSKLAQLESETDDLRRDLPA